jgi:acetyl-CoA C-acetyltransferase
MREVVVVSALRSPIGKKNGSLAGVHALDLLGTVLKALVTRAGVDPGTVGQVIGGCVGQVGMQSMNVTRSAWLSAGLPPEVPSTTVDAQCGSSQQASTLAYSLIAAGLIDTAIACGVEVMSRVPLGSTTPRDPDVGKPINRAYWKYHEYTTQFEGAERMAQRWGISRADADAFGLLSQERSAAALREDRFASQLVPIEVPERGADGANLDTTVIFDRDEAPRPSTLEGLARLKPTGRPGGVHTAGTSSQIADGAAALLLMSRDHAGALGLTPLATVADTCLVGCDPVLMLEGPIPATRKLLGDNGLSINDIDVVEINEAFASVVLAWEQEIKADMSRVNPNGGAIALGHPLGGSGARIMTTMLYHMRDKGIRYGLQTMCEGGGQANATIVELL